MPVPRVSKGKRRRRGYVATQERMLHRSCSFIRRTFLPLLISFEAQGHRRVLGCKCLSACAEVDQGVTLRASVCARHASHLSTRLHEQRTCAEHARRTRTCVGCLVLMLVSTGCSVVRVLVHASGYSTSLQSHQALEPPPSHFFPFFSVERWHAYVDGNGGLYSLMI